MKHMAAFLKRPAGLFPVLLAVLLCLCIPSSAETFIVPAGTLSIEEEAFFLDASLDKVVLSEPVETVGRLAFGYSSVRLLYLPDSLTFIADNALEGCPGDLVCIASPDSYARRWCDARGVAWCAPGSLLSLSSVEPSVVLKNGASQSLQVTPRPAGTRARLVWSSSDESVCTVDSRGVVFGVYPGQAVVTAAASDGSASVQIPVTVQANYRALLFSESTFPDGDVNRNRGDVRIMKEMLDAAATPDGGKYTCYTFDDLIAPEVYQKITDLLAKPSRDGDVSIFFFASHGDKKSTTRQLAGRLFCKNRATWLELPTLAQELAKVNGKVIVLLESCGPGAALMPYASPDGAAEPPAETPAVSSQSAGCGDFVPADDTELEQLFIRAFRAADPGLPVPQPSRLPAAAEAAAADSAALPLPKAGNNLFMTEKFVVMTAASYLQTSYMLGPDVVNLFPYWLTQGVIGPGGPLPADRECGDSDGRLTVKELYKYVYLHTRHKQDPLVWPQNSDYVLFVAPE